MIDRESIQHLALLARLGLSDEEMETMREDLSQIISNFERLSGVDTSAILPTTQVIPLENNMRDDQVRDCLSVEDVLANVPRVEDGFIRVPAVLKEF